MARERRWRRRPPLSPSDWPFSASDVLPFITATRSFILKEDGLSALPLLRCLSVFNSSLVGLCADIKSSSVKGPFRRDKLVM